MGTPLNLINNLTVAIMGHTSYLPLTTKWSFHLLLNSPVIHHTASPAWNMATKRRINMLTCFQFLISFKPPIYPWLGEPLKVPAVGHWFQDSDMVWDSSGTSLNLPSQFLYCYYILKLHHPSLSPSSSESGMTEGQTFQIVTNPSHLGEKLDKTNVTKLLPLL